MLKYLHEGEYRTNTKCSKEDDEEEPGDLCAILCGLNVTTTINNNNTITTTNNNTSTMTTTNTTTSTTIIIIITILLHRLAGTTRW